MLFLFTDNLLSPLRDTTLITNTEIDSAEAKPSPIEVIASPVVEVTDKENIEPAVSITKDQISVLQQKDSVPFIYKPQEKESFPTLSSQKAEATSPCIKPGKVSQELHLTPKMDMEVCENPHSPHGTQGAMPAVDSAATGGQCKVTQPSSSHKSPAPYFTLSPSTPCNRRLSPPKKRQLLRPVQAADLDADTPPGRSEAPAATDVAEGES